MIVAKILNALTGDLLGKVLDIIAKAIPDADKRADLEAQIRAATADSLARQEQAWAGAAADMVKAAQASIAASPALQRAMAAISILSTFVLLWYAIGAPAYEVITGRPWPAPAITLEWFYAIVLAQMGISYGLRAR